MFKPGGVSGISRPNEVTDSVQLIHDLFKPDFKHLIHLASQSANAPGTGADLTILGFESLPGYIYFPLSVGIRQTGVASIECRPTIKQTGSVLNVDDFSTVEIQNVIDGLRSEESKFTSVTAGVVNHLKINPTPRGLRYDFVFVAATNLITFTIDQWGFQLPIECVDFQMLVQGATGFV